ncbi:hypothetical protein BJY00DRAFT_311850 [Aspergillus carlsbadensis]|nr:hypothetical protein BJY00DRAFT_311850 [Aspergillus carlsbadensis]
MISLLDGALPLSNRRRPKETLTIIKTKARQGREDRETILMQETAGVVAWAKSRPDCQLVMKGCQLLISQDRHQAWRALARVEREYVNYLRNGVIGDDA